MARRHKQRGWLSGRLGLSLAVVLLVVPAACGGADSEALKESEAARLAAESRVAELEAQVADLEALEQEAAKVLPDIGALVTDNNLSRYVDDMDVDFASIAMSGVALVAVSDQLENLFADLGFPSSTMSRIGNTRALDGTQTADGDNASVYWSYHPDDGLSIVIERDQS